MAMVTEAVHREGRARRSTSPHDRGQQPWTQGRDGSRIRPHPDSRSASDPGIKPAAGENLSASRRPAHLIIFFFEFLKPLDSGFVVAPLRVSDEQTK